MDAINETLATLRGNIEELATFISENVPGGNLSLVASCAVLYLSVKYLNHAYQNSKAKSKIAARKVKIAANKARLEKRLQQAKNIDISITDLPFAVLQSKLQRGDLKPTQVLLAYQAKALETTKRINCVTEFVEYAEKVAQDLDMLDPSKRGPLHGIPFSVKEVVGIKGMDCTAAMTCFVDDILPEDAVLVKVLLEQGAIPFAKTNTPQAQSAIACSNPLFGETFHPINQERTCGGSTGGEGALIGAGASIMGIGCDMGGSIRIPCHFCGVTGFKPTPHRLSGAGSLKYGQGIMTIAEMYGPIGRDVTAITELFKASVSPSLFDLDPLLPQLPWREEMYSNPKPMKIGFYVFDGGVECTTAVKRAVLETKKVLEKRGHTVVEFNPPNMCDVLREFYFPVVCGDDGQDLYELMKHDELDPNMSSTLSMTNIPGVVRRFLGRVFGSFLHPVERAILMARPPLTVSKWWALNQELEDFKLDFYKTWKAMDLDGLIFPVFPVPAPPRGQEGGATIGMTYTAFGNVLGFPCGVVPVTKVEKRDVDTMKREYPQKTRTDKYVHSISDEKSIGLPIGVQCAALPFQEEVTLKLMREVEDGYRG